MSGLPAAEHAAALADRADLGRLIATGPDILGLLHRLSTGDVEGLRPGEGKETVLTSAKGRIVERLFVHHLGDAGVLLVAGTGGAPRVQAHLAKYTFAENTGLSDITGSTFAFAIIGPKWEDAARAAGIPELAPLAAAPLRIADIPAHAARTNGFDAQGVLVIGPKDDAARAGDALLAAARTVGGGAIDAEALEAWRILRGLPAAGSELSEERNPLEAGLYSAVSFTKGCYVGQEVVARLNTYDKVSRSLIRLRLTPGDPVPRAGASVVLGDRTIGEVTSATLPPGHDAAVALAFVKTREVPADAASLAIEDRGTTRPAALLRS